MVPGLVRILKGRPYSKVEIIALLGPPDWVAFDHPGDIGYTVGPFPPDDEVLVLDVDSSGRLKGWRRRST